MGLSTDMLAYQSEQVTYSMASTPFNLTSIVSFDRTEVGVNFITMSTYLVAPAANWANNTSVLVYFQIEQPPTTASRLLQASDALWFEGWAGALSQRIKTNSTTAVWTKPTLARNINTYGA